MKNIFRFYSYLVFISVPFLNVCGQVRPFQYPDSYKDSKYYSVSGSGKNLFVFDNPVASFSSFELVGKTLITIRANQDVKWVDVRPKNLHIKFNFGSDSTIQITLEHPCNISIELNGHLERPLFIFANAPETSRPDSLNKNLIYYKAGFEYNIGQVNLKSGSSVYLEGGTVVHGSITALEAKHIRIYGRGILDGSDNQKSESHAYRRGIYLLRCSDITIDGIILSNGTTWQIAPFDCENLTVNNVKVISQNPSDDGIDIVLCRHVKICNSFIRTKDDCIAIKAFDEDGMEKTESFDINVKNCVFWNGPWGNGIEIGFELEAKEVRNILIYNCDIIHVERGAALSIHNAGKSLVRKVSYDSIRLEDIRGKIFDFSIFISKYSRDSPVSDEEINALYLNGAWDNVLSLNNAQKQIHSTHRGGIQDIELRNIYLNEGVFPFSIFAGFDSQHLVKNITITNWRVYGRKITNLKMGRIYHENTTGLRIE